MHRGSLIALQEHAMGKYPGMKICFASSADTPFAEKVGRATLKLLEVVPGMIVWDLVLRDWDNQDVNQIGRQPPLSRYAPPLYYREGDPSSGSWKFNETLTPSLFQTGSNKARSHFPRLREITGIPYDNMLFFDDW
jgi:hypothetical protein